MSSGFSEPPSWPGSHIYITVCYLQALEFGGPGAGESGMEEKEKRAHERGTREWRSP